MMKKIIFILFVFVFTKAMVGQQDAIKRIYVTYSENLSPIDSISITHPDSIRMQVRISYADLSNQKEICIKMKDEQSNLILTKTLVLDNSALRPSTLTEIYERANVGNWNPYCNYTHLTRSQKYLIKYVEVSGKDNNGTYSKLKIYEF